MLGAGDAEAEGAGDEDGAGLVPGDEIGMPFTVPLRTMKIDVAERVSGSPTRPPMNGVRILNSQLIETVAVEPTLLSGLKVGCQVVTAPTGQLLLFVSLRTVASYVLPAVKTSVGWAAAA